MVVDDEELMRRFQGGDESAYEMLVDRNLDFVIRQARRYIRDLAGAEDVAQDVFFRVWKSKDRFRHAKSFRGWLTTMTSRIALNEIRTRSRKRWRPRSSLGSDDFESPGVEWVGGSERSSDPDAELLRKERIAMVNAAIENLGEPARQVIYLHYFEQWPVSRIAENLGLTVAALKSVLFRARKKMSIDLEQYIDKDENDRPEV